MKREKDVVVKTWRQPKYVLIIFLFFIFVLMVQFMYLSLSNKVYGRDLKQFAKDRITVDKELYAKRGTIFDRNEKVLAENVTSYTLIAYLDSSRTTNPDNPQHVVDKEATAKALSEVLDAPYDYILERLQKEGAYQVQFGNYGSKLKELKKIEIENLELPGLDFIESSMRSYPQGAFASYIIGYAKNDNEGSIYGEMGVELGYDSLLRGTNGSLTYQKDLYGYQIPDTPETRVDAIDGDDLYLTIDSKIQRFLEDAVAEASEKAKPEWMLMAIMDAKTGEILGSATSPTFNPNSLPENMSYQNHLISEPYEPGSVMKTFTYLCAIDTGEYDGNKEYASGHYKVGPNTVYDWNRYGWGKISYDTGYQYSSNVGAMHVAKEYLSPSALKQCLYRFGFGKQTGIELSSEDSNINPESAGNIEFNEQIELDWLSVSYGQGFLVTPIQILQALTIIANDGVMVKPHIIKKIVDKETNEEVETKIEKTGQIVKKESVLKMRELMYGAVNNSWAPGHHYQIEGFDIIGKTGTAQIAENGHYLQGDSNYLISFAGMFPKDDPQIIVYAAMKKPKTSSSNNIAKPLKVVLQNLAKYLNIFPENNVSSNVQTYVLPSYVNQDTAKVKQILQKEGLEVVVIGDGTTVIQQYPQKGATVISDDKVFLVTNGSNRQLADVVGWSKSDFVTYMNLLGVSYETEGYGFVTKQSIAKGTDIEPDMILEVTLENKYGIDKKKEEELEDKKES